MYRYHIKRVEWGSEEKMTANLTDILEELNKDVPKGYEWWVQHVHCDDDEIVYHFIRKAS